MDDEENRVLAILDSYSLEIPHTFEYAPEETVDVYDYVVHTPFESEESVKVLADNEIIELDLPKEGYGSANFFFRGPFWDLHYWDPTSQKRFVDVVHKMWTGK